MKMFRAATDILYLMAQKISVRSLQISSLLWVKLNTECFDTMLFVSDTFHENHYSESYNCFEVVSVI
jgi:hypothetical protein